MLRSALRATRNLLAAGAGAGGASYAAGWWSWVPTNPGAGLEAQHALLRHFVKTKLYPKTTCINGSGVCINWVDTASPDEVASGVFSTGAGRAAGRPPRTLVLAHGLGSGLGMFFANVDPIVASGKYDRVVMFDWMGFGSSSRPPFDNDQPERFFVDSFKAFVEHDSTGLLPPAPAPSASSAASSVSSSTAAAATTTTLPSSLNRNGAGGFDLCGHSLGGYLSALYACENPHHTRALYLASPVGFPRPPAEDKQVPAEARSWRLRLGLALWDAGATPMQLVRLAGWKGPELVNGIIQRRFNSRWSAEEARLVSDYVYHITVSRGSGEFALGTLLKPHICTERAAGSGVYARKRALVDVLSQACEEEGAASLSGLPALPFPVHICYGDNDWLYSKLCTTAVADLRSKTGSSRNKGPTLSILAQAGHHVYLDNVAQFTEWLGDAPN